MEELNLDNKTLRRFGIIMGLVFFIITLLFIIRHNQNLLVTFSVSIIFFILSFIFPALLKPIYIIWMRLAFVLSWINTRLILFIIFYLIFTPIGLGMRLFGIDLLDRRIEENKDSYWKKKDKKFFNPLDYERQF